MMRQRRGGGGTETLTSEEYHWDDDNRSNRGSLLDLSSKTRRKRKKSSWLFPCRQHHQKIVVVRFSFFILMSVTALLFLSKIVSYLVYIGHQMDPAIVPAETPIMRNSRNTQSHRDLDVSLDKRIHYYEPILHSTDTYDVFACPEIPPINYPREYPILDVLKNFPSNQTTIDTQETQQKIYQGVCIIDVSSISNAKQIISNYRSAEVPFVICNERCLPKRIV